MGGPKRCGSPRTVVSRPTEDAIVKRSALPRCLRATARFARRSFSDRSVAFRPVAPRRLDRPLLYPKGRLIREFVIPPQAQASLSACQCRQPGAAAGRGCAERAPISAKGLHRMIGRRGASLGPIFTICRRTWGGAAISIRSAAARARVKLAPVERNLIWDTCVLENGSRAEPHPFDPAAYSQRRTGPLGRILSLSPKN